MKILFALLLIAVAGCSPHQPSPVDELGKAIAANEEQRVRLDKAVNEQRYLIFQEAVLRTLIFERQHPAQFDVEAVFSNAWAQSITIGVFEAERTRLNREAK